MSRESLWAEIGQLKAVATTVSQQIADEAVQLTKSMEDGISLPVAIRIVNTIWGSHTQSSQKLKVQLSDSFPKSNRDVIRYTALPADELRKLTGELEEVVSYFALIQEYIEKLVCAITAHLVKGEPTPEGQEAVDEFRRNVLQYCCYINGYFYEVKDMVNDEACTAWDHIRIVPTGVLDGDYLFIQSFKDQLTADHEEFLKRTFFRQERDYWSLEDIKWSSDRLVPYIKLPFLFAEWLNATYADVVLAEPAGE